MQPGFSHSDRNNTAYVSHMMMTPNFHNVRGFVLFLFFYNFPNFYKIAKTAALQAHSLEIDILELNEHRLISQKFK